MNNTITLTKVLSPLSKLDKDVIQYAYVPENTLADIRKLYLPSDISFIISLNGAVVPHERWDEIYLHHGDSIVCVPEFQGGDDGKMILRIVAMTAIAIAAGPIGGSLAGSMGFGTSGLAAGILAGGVMLVGGLLVNALLPVPKPKLPTLGDDFSNSSSYGWNPASLQQQGVSIPRAYGRNKLYGNIIGAYTDIETDRSGNKQYYNALISLGYGPFQGISTSEMKVNDQVIANFDNVVPEFRLGYLDQDAVFNFKETVIEHSVGQKVTKANNGAVYTPAGTEYDNLEIELSFPSGLWELKTDGSYATNYVDFSVEVTGPSGYDKFLTKSYSNVTLQTVTRWSLGRYVSSRTDPITGFENESFWLEVLAGETGEYYNREGAHEYYHVSGGIESGYSTEYRWKYFNNTSVLITTSATTSIVNQQRVFSNKTKTPVVLKFNVGDLVYGSYTITVKRISNDSTSDYVADELYFSTVRELVSDTFTYPRHALVGLNALGTDQLSGSLNFSCIADCLLVRVWDGAAWSIKWSDNPAWVLYDLLTQPVYSGNTPETLTVARYDAIDPARLDLPKFLEWAEWCDTLCPDGNGGTEKRITFNGIFDSETNLWDGAMQICQIGGASLVWTGIKLTLAIDKPANPVQLFSVGNVAQDSFTSSFLSMEDRAAEIECDFTNVDKDYKRDKFSVVNPNITTIASKVNLPMFGVVKPSEVWRLAKRRLAYNEFITRTGSFTADIDAIACTVGDVVLLQHDVPQWGFGGRIVAATLTSVTLDQTVTIESGKTYSVLVRTTDDTIRERTVVNGPGTTATLNVTPSFGVTPQQYDLYAFGPVDFQAKPVRVTGINRNNELQATIEWIEYNETIYATDQDEPALHTLNYSSLPSIADVTDVVLSEQSPIDESGVIKRKIAVSWSVSNEVIVDKYEVYVRIGYYDTWKLYTTVYEKTAFVENVLPSTVYCVKVIAVTPAGLKPEFNKVSWYYLITTLGSAVTSTQLLAGVRGLQIFGQGNDSTFVGKDVRFIWNKVSSVDQVVIADGVAGTSSPDLWFRDYEVKILDTNGIVKRTEYVTLEQYSYSFQKNYDDNAGNPVRTFKIEVRARDKFYRTSVNPAVITVTNPAPEAVTGVSILAGLQSYTVDFQPSTTPDVAYYIVYASSVSGFTPDESLIINRGPDTHIVRKAAIGTYYIKIAAVDTFGEGSLIYSPEYTVSVTGNQIPPDDLYAVLRVDFLVQRSIFYFGDDATAPTPGTETTLYWTDGSIIRGSSTYTLTGGSMSSATNKWIIATLAAGVATLSLVACGSEVPNVAENQVIVGSTSDQPIDSGNYLANIRQSTNVQYESANIRNLEVDKLTGNTITGKTIQTGPDNGTDARIAIFGASDTNNHQMTFYDNVGGGMEQLIRIGKGWTGLDGSLATFGSYTAGNNTIAIVAKSYSNTGLYAFTLTGFSGVIGQTDSTNAASRGVAALAKGGNGLLAYSESGYGVSSSSLNKVGGKFGGAQGAVVLAGNTSAPTTPEEGVVYYNSTDKHFYGYNGTTWKQLDN